MATTDKATKAKENKSKAIELAIGQIEKQFGKGSIMRMGEGRGVADIEAISTGSPALDIALGIGGIHHFYRFVKGFFTIALKLRR